MRNSIGVFNRKGGVGRTFLSAHLCYHAQSLGYSTLGVSLDQNLDLAQWLEPDQWVDGTADDLSRTVDLSVLDVWALSDVAAALRPKLWLMPIDGRMAFENGMRAAAEELVGPILCVWSRVPAWLPAESSSRIPAELTGRVCFADTVIPRCPELDTHPTCVWSDARTANSLGALATEQLMREVMCRAGLEVPGARRPSSFPKVVASPPRDIHNHYRVREATARSRIIAAFG